MRNKIKLNDVEILPDYNTYSSEMITTRTPEPRLTGQTVNKQVPEQMKEEGDILFILLDFVRAGSVMTGRCR